tara:strand:+ start:981 stop:1541 length:561 start_codon:yes stop_codon:yes gene_type:complete
MNDKLKSWKKDTELQSHAKAFVKEFLAAAATTDEDVRRIIKSGSFMGFAGGTIENTEGLVDSLSKLVSRAANLLGPKAGNEKALREIAMRQAREAVIAGSSADAVEPRLIDALLEEGNAKFKFLAPNYLVLFADDVQAIELDRVRAMWTKDFAAELPDTKIKIIPDKGFSIEFKNASPDILVRILE